VGTDGSTVPDPTLGSLRAALDAKRDRAIDLRVLSALADSRFRVTVEVLAAPDRDKAVVQAAVQDAVRSAFAVDRRDFGQAVTAAEVTTLVQGVTGVRACRITDLRVVPPVEDTARVDEVLPAPDARIVPTLADSDHAVPAELLLVDPDLVTVAEMAP
jgi:hypothetical protein